MTANPLANITNNLNELDVDKTTFAVLKETLYPGAKDESIIMVLNYCKARKMDPLLKPVHLVPMSVKSGKKDSAGKDVWEWRDVVMPGIALYRIDASRSGQYAGMSEPVFGAEIVETIGTKKTAFPKWCSITVKKILSNGTIAEFTAKELWKENYATASKTDPSPNMMWFKRPYGQLAKCCEAQALRKAFPDILGQEYTHEEMEGKTFKPDTLEVEHNPETGEVKEQVKPNEMDMHVLMDNLSLMDSSSTVDLLKEVYTKAYRKFSHIPEFIDQLVKCKDDNLARLAILAEKMNQSVESEPLVLPDIQVPEGNPY